jgi:hypothetical protein
MIAEPSGPASGISASVRQATGKAPALAVATYHNQPPPKSPFFLVARNLYIKAKISLFGPGFNF